MTITHNKLRIGICTEYKHYREIEDGEGNIHSGNQTPQPCTSLRSATLLASSKPHYLGVRCAAWVFKGLQLSIGTKDIPASSQI